MRLSKTLQAAEICALSRFSGLPTGRKAVTAPLIVAATCIPAAILQKLRGERVPGLGRRQRIALFRPVQDNKSGERVAWMLEAVVMPWPAVTAIVFAAKVTSPAGPAAARADLEPATGMPSVAGAIPDP